VPQGLRLERAKLHLAEPSHQTWDRLPRSSPDDLIQVDGAAAQAGRQGAGGGRFADPRGAGQDDRRRGMEANFAQERSSNQVDCTSAADRFTILGEMKIRSSSRASVRVVCLNSQPNTGTSPIQGT
jgi:hypothetical protein